MNKKRWNYLSQSMTAQLTEEEIKEGWHFCLEWDGLLIRPGMSECDGICLCSSPALDAAKKALLEGEE